MRYLVILLLLCSVPALAKTAPCPTIIAVKVNGLVCDFCARAIEKTFGKEPSVADIQVNLDAGDIRITLKPGEGLDDAIISQRITDAGYNLTRIERQATTECAGGHG